MKFHKKKLILAAVLLLIIFAAAVNLFLKRSQVISLEKLLWIKSDKVDLEVQNVLYREVGERDDSKWEIKARKASYMKKAKKAFFENLEARVFLSGGRSFLMTGVSGQMDTATKDFIVTGNVSIITGPDNRFETEYLEYSYADKTLHTGAPVVMTTPKMQIRGVGMTLSMKDNNVILLSKVQAHIERAGEIR